MPSSAWAVLAVLIICSTLWSRANEESVADQALVEESFFAPTSRKRAGPDWWSLQPLKSPPVPQVDDQGWGRNPIDAFVWARLGEAGLRPSPRAASSVLLRRLTFDLTGLPPAPESIAAFEALEGQSSEAAWTQAIERLLASPRYGERWARHWLDVARYGESDGFEYDKLRPHAWPYRDWVVKALNADMPYDRFVRLQIAGDVMEPENPDAVVATSFLVCGAFDSLKPAGEKMRLVMRQDEMEDLVGIVGQSFLGMTVHCARCHDHKFDPIRQSEYYRIAAALAGVHRGDRELPPALERKALQSESERVNALLAELKSAVRRRLADDQGGQGNISEPSHVAVTVPAPLARWTFDGNLDDELGELHAQSQGKARVEDGVLWLDGVEGYAATVPLTQTLQAKTLEAWVRLESLEQQGGGILTVQTLDGAEFDSLVYAERQPGQWMAGSEHFRRTRDLSGPAETNAQDKCVHVAVTYEADGTIRLYRQGKPYAPAYKSDGPKTFAAGQAQIVFGMRHGTAANRRGMLAGRIDRAQLYDVALTAEEVAASAQGESLTEEMLVQSMTEAERERYGQWQREAAELNARLEDWAPKQAFAVTPNKPPVTRVLLRGSPFQPGDVVAPGGVAAVAGLEAGFGLEDESSDAARRQALARWVTDARNPLFARTMVNRVWHYHFGQGLVTTPNDLGFSGGLPSHPELLDWLACEFRDQGWSLKSLHALIVGSATYRQASAWRGEGHGVDAGNRLLWRYTPRRMEAEVLRDSLLEISGQLNGRMGGEGFQDFDMHLHKGSWMYDPLDPEGFEYNRRSLYRVWARGSDHALLSAFDCPDPSTTTPVRSVTTTPLSALSLWNTSFVLRMADHLAARLERECGSDLDRQIERGYLLALGRRPDAEELAWQKPFVRRHGLPAFCRVLFNTTEFIYIQ